MPRASSRRSTCSTSRSVIVVNKADKRGADDALRDVRKQWRRNRVAFEAADAEIPVFATVASQFGDPGVNRFFSLSATSSPRTSERRRRCVEERPTGLDVRRVEPATAMIPVARSGYLGRDRGRRPAGERDGSTRSRRWRIAPSTCTRRFEVLGDADLPAALEPYGASAADPALDPLRPRYDETLEALGAEALSRLLRMWPARRQGVTRETSPTTCAAATITGRNYRDTLSGLQRAEGRGSTGSGLGRPAPVPAMSENLPGCVSRTRPASIPTGASGEDPIRMFAGEGNAGAHQPALPLPFGRPACRPALDRVRLGDAVRRRPARAPRHLRQGRELGRLDRDRRRCEAALLRVRSLLALHVGLDDDQRPGPDHPGVLHERCDRPAGGEAPPRDRRWEHRVERGRDSTAGTRPALPRRAAGGARRSRTRASRRRRATRSSSARPTSGSRPRRSRAFAAPFRPTSSRRIRLRTRASSRPSSR